MWQRPRRMRSVHVLRIERVLLKHALMWNRTSMHRDSDDQNGSEDGQDCGGCWGRLERRCVYKRSVEYVINKTSIATYSFHAVRAHTFQHDFHTRANLLLLVHQKRIAPSLISARYLSARRRCRYHSCSSLSSNTAT
jgi:hypothetical protein